METTETKPNEASVRPANIRVSAVRALIVVCGIGINVGLAKLVYDLQLPLYLDTVGTVLVAWECGPLLGILTALASNIACGFFSELSIYYAIVNILVAVSAAWMFYLNIFRRRGGVLVYVTVLAVVGSVFGTLVEWALNSGPGSPFADTAATQLTEHAGVSRLLGTLLVSFGMNFVDKAVSSALSWLLTRLVPGWVRSNAWEQNLRLNLRAEEKGLGDVLRNKGRSSRHRRLLVLLVVEALALAGVTAWISVTLYTSNAREARVATATGAAQLAAGSVDADRVSEYIELGFDAQGYTETREQLRKIWQNTPFLKYVYVYQILDDGCQVVFDVSPEDEEGSLPGDMVDFDETFLPLLPTLHAGGRIDPIESNDSYGWLLTAYEPIYNGAGRCTAYAGADISMEDLRAYVSDFLLRIVLISSAFLVFSLVLGLWLSSNYHMLDDWELLLERRRKDKLLIREIVEAFARVIDMKDKYTNGHSLRVARYTAMLARELGCDEETVEQYYNIALLHDIGKIGIPEEVLNKQGKLTDEEFHTIQSHTVLGEAALKDISIMPELAIGAGDHHERPDGKGYPRGLKGDQIPRVAQIIAVADCFDAMYSKRPYRDRMNFDKVVSIIRDCAGTQLTADVVEAFLRLAEQGVLRDPDDHGGGATENIDNLADRSHS